MLFPIQRNEKEDKADKYRQIQSGSAMPMNQQKSHTTTTFQLSNHLHTQLKMMCMLTHKSMGEFIRVAIIDKMRQLNEQRENEQRLGRK